MDFIADTNVIPYLLQRPAHGATGHELTDSSTVQEIDSALDLALRRAWKALAESQIDLDREARHVLYSRMRELYWLSE